MVQVDEDIRDYLPSRNGISGFSLRILRYSSSTRSDAMIFPLALLMASTASAAMSLARTFAIVSQSIARSSFVLFGAFIWFVF